MSVIYRKAKETIVVSEGENDYLVMKISNGGGVANYSAYKIADLPLKLGFEETNDLVRRLEAGVDNQPKRRGRRKKVVETA